MKNALSIVLALAKDAHAAGPSDEVNDLAIKAVSDKLARAEARAAKRKREKARQQRLAAASHDPWVVTTYREIVAMLDRTTGTVPSKVERAIKDKLQALLDSERA